MKDLILEKIYSILCYLGHQKSCRKYNKYNQTRLLKGYKYQDYGLAHEDDEDDDHNEKISKVRDLKCNYVPYTGGSAPIRNVDIKESYKHKHHKKYFFSKKKSKKTKKKTNKRSKKKK